jgi:hypothetical protein
MSYTRSNRLNVNDELGRITIALALVYMENNSAFPWKNWGKTMENLILRLLDLKMS